MSIQEEKKRKSLKVRLEMARFLQETISETGFAGSDNEESAKDFADFFRKVSPFSSMMRVSHTRSDLSPCLRFVSLVNKPQRKIY